jgi:ADP-ribose pyrophosphatase YjhB (NUDIX family)
MQIHSTLTNHAGQTLSVVYNDVYDVRDFVGKNIEGVHAYCFYGDKLVLVYSHAKKHWTPPGGGVEVGEDVETAVRREVAEETNMKVLWQQLIGCQDVSKPAGIYSQTRSVCIVEPNGPFVSDPDGDISKIALIDPKDYKQYFDWGEIGDHIMKRALDLLARIKAE